ncbi:MAG: isocitrate/isopropylmalate dehydrogenase family protein, partial [Clostridia bacterium]|nr:isocitrate/isopropylmalate dehydrogenase family protein [Clostridia bacterium]
MQQYIDNAVEQFRTLITEQLARQNRMEAGEDVKDFAHMEHLVIGICGGDGIGPIITHAGEDVLRFLRAEDGASGRVEVREIDGLTIERRTEVGKAIPDDTLAALKACDVILKGPTTTPHGGTMESANVSMRRELDLYT